MNVVLWLGQSVLAALFAVSGGMKLTMRKQRLLDTGQTGVVFFPPLGIKLIAASELLGVLGVLLPWATGVARVLTPLAATGLGVVMIGAAVCHTRLREPRNVAINVVLLGVCVLVAVGRFAWLS